MITPVKKSAVRNRFPEQLKQIRKFYHMTQTELADLMDVTSAAIYNYENGKREPKITDLIRLSIILDVSIDFLTGKADVCENFPAVGDSDNSLPPPSEQ